MARVTKPLTNTEIDKAQAKVSSLFDGDGLELRINPTGTKK